MSISFLHHKDSKTSVCVCMYVWQRFVLIIHLDLLLFHLKIRLVVHLSFCQEDVMIPAHVCYPVNSLLFLVEPKTDCVWFYCTEKLQLTIKPAPFPYTQPHSCFVSVFKLATVDWFSSSPELTSCSLHVRYSGDFTIVCWDIYSSIVLWEINAI